MPGTRSAGTYGDAYERTTTILVVEDDFAVAELLRSVINGTPGWGAIVVQDPAGALEVLQHVPVDLLVVDVNLPGMSGPELLERLHATKHWHNPPAIFMSAAGTHPEVERALREGLAERFIAKPFDLDDLMDAMKAATRHAPRSANTPSHSTAGGWRVA